MRTRTRTRLLSSFAIEIEYKHERVKPSTAFEAARLLLAARDSVWSFGIMAQVKSDTEAIEELYLFDKTEKEACVAQMFTEKR